MVGDLCRSIGRAAIAPIADVLMEALLGALQDNNLHRSIKPQIFSVFGDIALAVGPHFAKYLDVVVTVMEQAGGFTVSCS